MISIHISNNLTAIGCPPELISVTKKVLTIENPAYHRVVRITGNSWAAPRDFKYYKLDKFDPSKIIIPRGMRVRFLTYLTKQGYQYEATESFVEDKIKDKLKFTGKLRDYQEPLVTSSMAVNEGLIAASVGAGKTLLSLEIIRRLGLTALILVPNTVLLKQFVEEAKKWYNYDLGVCSGEKKEFKDITVATWQILMADEAVLSWATATTSVLIVDEAQGVVSDSRMGILSKFKPKHLYGLSGTPKRSKDDGKTNAIFFLMGSVCAEYKSLQHTPTVEIIRTGAEIEFIDYHTMIDDMVNHTNRNTLITGLCLGEIVSGRKVLLLTKRIEHYKKIEEKIGKEFDGLFFIDSVDKDRNETLMKLKNREIDFRLIAGTTSLLAVGLDIAPLDVVIIACDLKSDVTLIQAIGRILRLMEGKPQPRVIDLWDDKNPILTRQFFERARVYEQQGWDIKGFSFKKKKIYE